MALGTFSGMGNFRGGRGSVHEMSIRGLSRSHTGLQVSTDRHRQFLTSYTAVYYKLSQLR